VLEDEKGGCDVRIGKVMVEVTGRKYYQRMRSR
jgi:hypothetical protein